MSILGYIAYEGPSVIDGAPIVVINRIDADSDNSKTGALVQSFIIRSDVPPVDALKTGDDESVCGDCKHRPLLAASNGEAPCYVNVGRSVRSVYDAYKRGRYVKAPLETIALALAGKNLRMGTYGDPAAAPAVVWHRLIRYCADWVGYSHQWRNVAAIDWSCSWPASTTIKNMRMRRRADGAPSALPLTKAKQARKRVAQRARKPARRQRVTHACCAQARASAQRTS